jgi:hypothetical protein
MKYIGEEFDRYRAESEKKELVKIPLIGVATTGKVYAHADILANGGGGCVEYKHDGAAIDASKCNRLNSKHSHFVFVGDASSGWGVEIPFRNEFEDLYANEGVPLVLVVANGGPGTIDTVLNW